jgi:hypothetical protein
MELALRHDDRDAAGSKYKIKTETVAIDVDAD